MSVKRTRAWLEEAGVRPSRRMGQNFLTDDRVLHGIAAEALVGDHRWILEIGAGPGNLTEHLLDGDAHVIALERDRRLARLCARRLGDRPNLTVLMGDALGLPLDRLGPEGSITVAGNIPYSITGEIIRRLGTSATQFYRLLDQTNYSKSIKQMVTLLAILDCEVDLVVRRKRSA